MVIQINTDHTIVGDSALTERVKAAVHHSVAHFSEQITRVDVHPRS